MKVCLSLILTFTAFFGYSQDDKTGFYLAPSVGMYNFGTDLSGFSAGVSLNWQREQMIYTFAPFTMSEFVIFGEDPDITYAFDVLVGKRYSHNALRGDIQGGLNLVVLESYTYTASNQISHYNFSPGIVFKAGGSIRLLGFVGFGVEMQGGLNFISSYYLLPMIKLELGNIL